MTHNSGDDHAFFFHTPFPSLESMSRNIRGVAPRVPTSRPSNAARAARAQLSQSSVVDDLRSPQFEQDPDRFNLAFGAAIASSVENDTDFDLSSLLIDGAVDTTDPFSYYNSTPSFNSNNTKGPTTTTALLADGGSDSIEGGTVPTPVTTNIEKHIPAGKSLLETVLSDPRAMLSNINMTSGIIPVVQNIVATVNVGCSLNLKTLAMQMRNAEFNPKRFIAVIMRIREPKATALIFQSGKIVITGTKNELDCRVAARKVCRTIQRVGYSQVRFMDFTIQNIVASADVHFPIKLEKLCNDNSDAASYEPELFPGLIYRMANPKVVLLVFVSGKIVITGARDRIQVYEAFENLYPILLRAQKENKQ